MSLFLANITGWIVAHWRIVMPIAAFLPILVLCIVIYQSCKSEPFIDNDKLIEQRERIEDREAEKLGNIFNRVDGQREQTNLNVKQAEANTTNAVNRNYSNTNLSEAEKARCRAFPERCKK